eukprot:scpid86247/ scgid2024/ JNK1/MAPK8-associated membrane protein; JNK1-associated membrane protein; Medulloblastoma antigen MU-MB-50.4 homolog
MLPVSRRSSMECSRPALIVGILCLMVCAAVGQDMCPGRYCGRTALPDNTSSNCGSCPRGSRALDHLLCKECTEPLTAYQWLYLLFMVVIVLAFNFARISQHHHDEDGQLLLHLSNFLEVSVAAILTLLSYAPQGHVKLQTCGVRQVSDWYPIFYNPSPDFTNTIYCTSEVVYPLYSIFFVFCGYYLLLLVPTRSILVLRVQKASNLESLYDTMFFLPVWALCHAVCAGLIYYAHPYLTLVAVFITSASYFAFTLVSTVLQKYSMGNLLNQ